MLVVAASGGSMGIGVPLGICGGASAQSLFKLHAAGARPHADAADFRLSDPGARLFGLGNAPGLIVTIIFVIPTAVRLTHLGMTGVPKPIIEAGEAFGATKQQLLWKVELPAALPTIMAALTQCIMLSLSMVVFAALIGAGGLATEINRALDRARSISALRPGLPSWCSPSCSTACAGIGKGAKS